MKTFVVVPCYNEARRLDLDAFMSFLAASDVTLVFVDDGSSDDTAAKLRAIRDRSGESAVVLVLERNAGKAEAIRTGVAHAAGRGAECVGYWDADLSTPLAEIHAFRDLLLADSRRVAVLGSRVRRLGASISRNAMRHYLGRVFATFASLVLELPVYDTQCGAKLFRFDDDVRAAFATPFRSRWIFDVELLARVVAAKRRASVAVEDVFYEYPLPRWDAVAGSKLGFADAVRAARDLWQIRRAYKPRRFQ